MQPRHTGSLQAAFLELEVEDGVSLNGCSCYWLEDSVYDTLSSIFYWEVSDYIKVICLSTSSILILFFNIKQRYLNKDIMGP